jgi:tripartite-type tricarboxylate transporter receptor subunit TctC
MLKLTAAAALLVVTSAAAFAQGFPAKTVRVVVGFPPGGAADIAARLISQKLGDLWGRQVIVDNRPGAGGNLAADMVAKAAPDGYTLHLAFGPTAPSMYPKLPFDPQKDFAPITLMAQSPMVLVVHPSLPASNVKELIALARSHPGKLNYASTGVGITVHLAMEQFRIMAKVNIVHVPYKGASPAVVDLVGGQVELTILSTSSILGQIKTQRVRALAVTSLERSFMLPDVPTLNEAGVAGYETTIWWGLSAPASTRRQSRVWASLTFARSLPTRERKSSAARRRNSANSSTRNWRSGTTSSGRPASARSSTRVVSSASPRLTAGRAHARAIAIFKVHRAFAWVTCVRRCRWAQRRKSPLPWRERCAGAWSRDPFTGCEREGAQSHAGTRRLASRCGVTSIGKPTESCSALRGRRVRGVLFAADFVTHAKPGSS